MCFFLCVVKSIILGAELREKVNRCMPGEEFDGARWGSQYQRHVIREYRRLYPGDRVLPQICVLNAVMLGCLLVEFVVFGSFK